MTWDDIDWSILERLRQRFLNSNPEAGPYWTTPEDLAHYDFTFAERIGWKWDHVLRELALRGWRPRARSVLDWGCGSGVAARRVIAAFGPENFDSLTVWDHSPLACGYAATAAQGTFPGLGVAATTPGFLAADEPIGLLVISHVLNELPAGALADLRRQIARADAVLWVEPGTSAVSRQLGAQRDAWREHFRLVAPCTHAGPCPVFSPGNERHWCHFFAPPPAAIFADSNWVKFGQRAGIDLRSLPYAFLALERRAEPGAAAEPSPGASRVVGRIEHFKPYARGLNCDATGLTDLELPKRADPALFKQLERTKEPLVYRWRREGDKVTGGEPWSAS